MFNNIKAVAFDLDGTIYRGDQIIEGANQVIRQVKDSGKRVFFLTNNSAKTRAQIFEKLQAMGVECSLEEVYTTSFLAALFVKQENIERPFIFGSEGLYKEFEALNIAIAPFEEAKNLIIGFEPDITYQKITQALRLALRVEKLIVCNYDRHYPGQNNELFPGCGAMAIAIEFCANRKADYVVGKPNTMMLEMVCKAYGYSNQELLMVGDNYETDIEMAKRHGSPSVFISKKKYDDTTSIETITELCNLI